MKTISRFLLVSVLLLVMVSVQEAMAGDCASGRCPFTSVAPSAPPAPATASASRGFTATGGTRVADVNLSPEGRARLAAGDKEEPLPKGFSTAADRAKVVAKPLKPREAKPFTRRSVAGPVKPRKSFAYVIELLGVETASRLTRRHLRKKVCSLRAEQWAREAGKPQINTDETRI